MLLFPDQFFAQTSDLIPYIGEQPDKKISPLLRAVEMTLWTVKGLNGYTVKWL